ncbi:5-methyltetrahydropteroyltriglutamate--homocysteine S-methyltransferase [Leeuwenhoekiella marinoflava]|uniref:5-methyltetrahydropteroyltriglutamate--homocysteine methyltransferase n=2 Tax=Leeuwenhoekiella marinoflava TaxID=988 RepID=A0A4Q0PEY9_9FLAO|nr:5-methyltetrahydropteroyltriglutamate--homocysteine S-methyltransferase [Leeuwenhoekiella marinoflava]RXG25467.1 methionine synthase (B12-independent) [Leeuwenhoekiella marinoflava]SHF86194.1 methionine synthase (B12-independent) [Leeuwenhoekiella marinoflava DSM 3653]
MQTHILGYPRIGSQRELKKACEQYWSGNISLDDLHQAGANIRQNNWKLQQEAGIDLIPSNDFSFYDQVLDMSLTVNAIPVRYQELISKKETTKQDLYFAMARGYQQDGLDITAMEMTKWFDTNYHYIVPEFKKDQEFELFSNKALDEFLEAKEIGILTKPVLLGPITYLLLGKEKEAGFNRLDLIDKLLPVYIDVLKKLQEAGAIWVQLDEPFLALDLTPKEQEVYNKVYNELKKQLPELKILLATYFEGLKENLNLAVSLPVCALHIDLVRAPQQLQEVLDKTPKELTLSLGIVDGRNIWKNDYQTSLDFIRKALKSKSPKRIMIAPSCSLLHVPCDLDLETNETVLTPEIKNWLAFAKQKLEELATLKAIIEADDTHAVATMEKLQANLDAVKSKQESQLIHKTEVKQRTANITAKDAKRNQDFSERKTIQHKALKLPLFPTTTIGSFPQTKEVRSWRAQFKKGSIDALAYENLLLKETEQCIRWQEEIDLDVLVHGEFERNDMVEYFGEQLNGFVFTKMGWVQSYGSRCVKPPIIYGDVDRPEAMTVKWSSYAQSLTSKIVKGMLTGPVTILQWSFVRNDQSRSETCNQIALAIRDEVLDLEKAGIRIIQIDEPAIREGLPLRKTEWEAYLKWAVNAFCISAAGVSDQTQIHTHMCYSEFNDIIEHIAAMDADVITIECSRSQMELLDAFAKFNYPNEIGPGVYDIHAPRVPSVTEMVALMEKAKLVIPEKQLWVNPDCGLKTRHWEETHKALEALVEAAKKLRVASEKERLVTH